jgi:transposase InsO family protein
VAIRCDNGPELTSPHFMASCVERKIDLVHMQPGRPMQNGQIGSFHGRLREEYLNVSWFGNLFEARGEDHGLAEGVHQSEVDTSERQAYGLAQGLRLKSKIPILGVFGKCGLRFGIYPTRPARKHLISIWGQKLGTCGWSLGTKSVGSDSLGSTV